MASTASSRSIRPQPPLVCHIPFSTRHISSESFRLLTVTRRFSLVAVLTSAHRTEFAPLPRRRESLAAEFRRVAVESRRWWWWLTIAAISSGLSLTQKTRTEEEYKEVDSTIQDEWFVRSPVFSKIHGPKLQAQKRLLFFLFNKSYVIKFSIFFQLHIN